MIPLNTTSVTAVHAQQQQQQQVTATRVPRSPTNAATDPECKLVAAADHLELSISPTRMSSASSRHSLGASANISSRSHSGISSSGSSNSTSPSISSDTGARSSHRPVLSVQTTTQCLCGEELCGFDCHFLQQEFQGFAAAELRRRRHRRSRSQRNQSERAAMAESGGSCSTASDRADGKCSDDSDSDSNDMGSGRYSDDSDDHVDNKSNEDDEAVVDLERRFRRYYSSTSARSTVGFDDSIVTPASLSDSASMVGVNRGGSSGASDDADTLYQAVRLDMRRSKSCGVHSSEFDQEQLVRRHNAYRLRIGYRDEALRERSERNTQALVQRAMTSDPDGATSTSTILARKALRYRKVLERMVGVDVTDPSLDVSKCLGVHWQRVSSLEQ